MLLPGRPFVPTPVRRFRPGRGPGPEEEDTLTVEEPLEIRVEHYSGEGPRTRSVSVTMRTPGEDFPLAAGFLFTEGLLTGRSELREISYCREGRAQEYNIVTARLAAGASFDPEELKRNFYMTSSCGICGKASLEAVETKGCRTLEGEGPEMAGNVVSRLPGALREAQPVFEKTGGIHAAALFRPDGELEALEEDVGRHNAVDKVVGRALLDGRLPLPDRVLAVSGRASFEILQKAVMARIAFVVAVGAPSSLAVDLARRFDLTLVGFAGSEGFNVYHGGHRIPGLRR